MKVGDHIRVKTKDNAYEGILMPRTELYDNEHIVIKLNSGYNIGIKKSSILKTELLKPLKTGKPTKARQKPDKTKPAISIVSTGGTITSKVDYKTGGVFPLTSPEALLSNVPQLKEIANVKGIRRPFRLLGEDMTPNEWPKIAKEVCKELNSGVQGVIVSHGTDTLHYTSAALSFMLKNLSKPVAVVGAQRSVDRGSFDGILNLLCGAQYCLSDIAEVAVVMHASMNDDYCIASRGTKVRKMHSSRRDAFRPISEMPLAKIGPEGNIVVLNSEHRQRSDSKVELDDKFEEKVALVYVYPGSKPEVLDCYLDKGYKGIIIAGTGFGHVPAQPLDKKLSWLPSIKRAINKGVFIGITTQALYGKTDPYIYSTGRLLLKEGAVFLKDMLPETAYVKLGWVLGHTKKREEAEKLMLTSFAGEIGEKRDPKAFLY